MVTAMALPVLLSACVALAAPALTPVAIEREVAVRTDAAETWTWQGLPLGPAELLGMPYQIPQQAEDALATARPITIDPPSPVVYALFSPVAECSLASLSFEGGGETIRVLATECALAWAAEPPHHRRLLIVRAVAPEGGAVRMVRPSGVYVFAVAVGGREAAEGAGLTEAYEQARVLWAERYAAEAPLRIRLQGVLDRLAGAGVALIPPGDVPPPVLTALAGEAGVRRVLTRLTPQELVDAQVFSAERFPLAIYVGGESYLRTVTKDDDGAQAVLRYLEEGGTLVLATLGPYPMFYAIDRGGPGILGDPLLARIGITCVRGVETPQPEWNAVIRPVGGQTVFPDIPSEWPYPTDVDQRLRALGFVPDAVGQVTPFLMVQQADGQPLGECCALFELGDPPGSRGTVLHIWGGLLADRRVSEPIIDGLVRWVADRLVAPGGGG